MNNIDIIKKLNNIPNDAAPVKSPNFTGVPTAPTADGRTAKQIANTEYVESKLNESFNGMNEELNKLKESASKFGDNVDRETLQENIKQEAMSDIEQDLVGKLSNNSIKILYSDISLQESAIVKYIDLVTELLDQYGGSNTEINKYSQTLFERKTNLTSYYNSMYAAYGYCTKGTILYTDFYQKFITWYDYMNDTDVYCEEILVNLIRIMMQSKANADHDTIFNLLTNNGIVKAIYEKDGKMYINGKYIDLRGAKVVDETGKVTFAVSNDGSSVDADLTNFTVNGRTLQSIVTQSITSSDIINGVIDTVITSMREKIENTVRKVDELEMAMKTVVEDVRSNIYEDLLTNSQSSAIQSVYSDIKSRYNAICTEIDSVMRLDGISVTDRNSLIEYKNSVTSAYNILTETYNQTQEAPTSVAFDNFNNAINTYNTYVGVAKGLCQTINGNIISTLTSNKMNANKQDLIDTLNGDDNIIYTNGDRIYINGENIDAYDFKTQNSMSTKYIYSENIKSNNIANRINHDCIIKIDKDKGNNFQTFTNGVVYDSLQGALNCIPNVIQRDVEIHLENDCSENIVIRSLIGGSLKIHMNGHKLYGNMLIENCTTSISVYGISEEDHPSIANRPCISPFDMLEYDGKYYTVAVLNSNNVYFRDVQLIGKVASEDNVYDKRGKNYVLLSSKGSNVEIEYSSVAHSDCGLCVDKCSRMQSKDMYGYTTYSGEGTVYEEKDAYTACNGGFMSITGSTRISGFIKSEEYGGIHYLASVTEPCEEESNVFLSTDIKSSSYNGMCTGIYYPYSNNSYDRNEHTWKYIARYDINENNNVIPFWFFGNQFDELKGKSIKEIELIINKSKCVRDIGDFKVSLKYHNYSNTTEAQNSIVFYNEGVPLSEWNDVITFIGDNDDVLITIKSGDILDALNMGLLKGFALDAIDKHYAEFNILALNVYYTE